MAFRGICSIEGCGKPAANVRGWCHRHYSRWRRCGDPLGGRIDAGAALKFYNDVVLHYEGADCLTWPYHSTKGRASIYVDGKQRSLCRLLCEHANGPPPTPQHQAAHSCGRGHLGCVSKAHLHWATPKENKADEVIHGTRRKGEKHHKAKVTEEQVKEILALSGTMEQDELGALYGVSQSTIHNICTGKTWGWVPGERHFQFRKKRKTAVAAPMMAVTAIKPV